MTLLTISQAAERLGMSPRTVQKHYGRFALENMRATTDRLYAQYARRTENET